jgi:hypothetical protein
MTSASANASPHPAIANTRSRKPRQPHRPALPHRIDPTATTGAKANPTSHLRGSFHGSVIVSVASTTRALVKAPANTPKTPSTSTGHQDIGWKKNGTLRFVVIQGSCTFPDGLT